MLKSNINHIGGGSESTLFCIDIIYVEGLKPWKNTWKIWKSQHNQMWKTMTTKRGLECASAKYKIHNTISCASCCSRFYLQAQLSVLTATVLCASAHFSVERGGHTLFCEVFHCYFQIWGKMRRRKKTQTQKCCRDSPAVKTQMNDLEVEWKSVCNVPCYDGLNACVRSGEMNITKLLQKVPDGDFQSGSEWGNMPHTDRVILIDGFSFFFCFFF